MTDSLQARNAIHHRHLERLLQLDFAQDQIKIFQNELSRVVHQHSDIMSIIEHVEEYRAILLKKLHHIDEFRSKIALLERALNTEKMEWPSEVIDEQHLEDDLDSFFAAFEVLKNTLRRFVSRND